jgi:predicted AAA+ superfamily ATPase
VEALRDSPVVLIHGARQCGKTTLAGQIGESAGFACYTFDEDV